MSASVRDIPPQPQKLSPWTQLILATTDIIFRRLYPCTITGLAHYTATPATLAVSNHRRDSDGPLLASILLHRQNGRIVAPLPYFAAREDLFEKGFLAHYLPCPAALRPLLQGINLSPCLVGAYPLQRTHERNVAKALRDVLTYLGDMPVADALRPQALTNLADELKFNPQTTTITQFLREHEHTLWKRLYGYRQLQLGVFRRLKPHLNHLINRQMDHFTQLLESGQALILEPEGRLSLDGTFRRPRASLHELANRPHRPVRILPVAFTYDALTTGSARIFVDIQPELTGLARLSRRVLDNRIMSSIHAGCRVTGSQLVAGFLLSRPHIGDAWSEAALIQHVQGAAQRCHERSIPLDPCLRDPKTCEWRTRDILAWGRRAGFIAPEGDDWRRVIAPEMPPPWLPDGPSTLLNYLRTELLETVGRASARALNLLPCKGSVTL